MFNFFKKKNDTAANPQKNQRNASPSSGVKQSLLSLEPRLMFDAAAAATASEVASEQVAQEQAEAAVSSDASHEAAGGEQGGGEDIAQALTTYMPAEECVEVAFVDPTVPNYRELLAGMDPNIEVIMLDGGQDGIEQMAEALSGRSDIDAIHVISHGGAGELQLGTGTLTAESMSAEYADELAIIRGTLSEQADLLVYGCNFGEGAEGVDAVNLLAELTGADVAASSDQTGHIDLGGDWEFEVQAGSIETDLALTDTAQMNWAGILGTETVADRFSDRSFENNDGTQSWSSDWAESDAGGHGAKGGDIRVNSGQLRIETDAIGNAISREVDLSRATSAALTFDYTNRLTGADRVELRVSSDGGATYRTVSSGTFSDVANTGSGTARFDLSGDLSANTRIQFIVTGAENGGGDRLHVDNVQVSYDTGPANRAPTISSNGSGTTASVTVAENSTVVTTVSAADADAGQSLAYSIAGGADAAKFTIDGSTGELRFASAPNYEAPTDSGGNNVYDVTVQVSAGQGGTDTQALAVTVANANEAPTDLSLSANTVAENAVNGTVVGTVSGTDPDASDTKTYSLTDTADGRFAIDSSTGQLTVADGSLLNYESATSHSVSVRVTDSGGQSYDETFTINLTNVNEAPTITSNGGGAAAAAVNVAENQNTVTMVAAMDVDTGTTLTYGIAGGPDAARFSIDSATGALRFSTAPNFERPSDVGRNNVYDVTVQVSDGQGGTATQSISVRVTDVNEAPRITSNRGGDVASVTIRENGSAVTTVRATDPDRGARITYSVVGGTDAALFTINPSSGVLRFSSAPNFEQSTDADRNNVYQVVVQASDGRGGTDSQVISVRVANVNEGPTGADATVTISEDTAQPLTPANFGFSDVDAGDRLSAVRIDTLPTAGTLTLSGVAVTAGQVVSVADITAGNLVFNPATEANGTNYASLTFSVRDSNRTYDATPNTLTVHVTAVNDVPTDLNLSANSVAENATTGTVVGTITGADPDAGDTKSYSLTDTAGGRFAINASTGVITVADGSLLNYEAATSHSLTVQVTDSGGQSYTETFTINLTNVNEGPTGDESTDALTENMAHKLTTTKFGIHDIHGDPKTSASEPRVSNELEESGFTLPNNFPNERTITTEAPVTGDLLTLERTHLSVASEKPIENVVNSKETQQSSNQNEKRGSDVPHDQTDIQSTTVAEADRKDFLEPDAPIENVEESTALKLSATMGLAGVVLQNSLGNTAKLSRLIPRPARASTVLPNTTPQKSAVDDHTSNQNGSEHHRSSAEDADQAEP